MLQKSSFGFKTFFLGFNKMRERMMAHQLKVRKISKFRERKKKKNTFNNNKG